MCYCVLEYVIFASTVLATLPIRTASQGESFAFIGVSDIKFREIKPGHPAIYIPRGQIIILLCSTFLSVAGHLSHMLCFEP